MGWHLHAERAVLGQFGVSECCGRNAVGMLEIVIVVGLLAGKDAATYTFCLEAIQADADGLLFIERNVGQGQNDAAILRLCSRS